MSKLKVAGVTSSTCTVYLFTSTNFTVHFMTWGEREREGERARGGGGELDQKLLESNASRSSVHRFCSVSFQRLIT